MHAAARARGWSGFFTVPAELPQRVRGFLLGKLVSEPRLPRP
jgi:hypothetical protein